MSGRTDNAATTEARKIKQHLRDLSAVVSAFLFDFDAEMSKRDVPDEDGRRAARLANALDLANDRVRYFALGVDYRTDKKEPPHPEETCWECGGRNVVWFAPNDVWNRVMRGGDRSAPDAIGIVCPTCFIARAEAAGVEATGWLVQPEVIHAAV